MEFQGSYNHRRGGGPVLLTFPLIGLRRLCRFPGTDRASWLESSRCHIQKQSRKSAAQSTTRSNPQPADTAKVNGSTGLRPEKGARPAETAIAMRTPAKVIFMPSNGLSRWISPGVAPRAIRNPISCALRSMKLYLYV